MHLQACTPSLLPRPHTPALSPEGCGPQTQTPVSIPVTASGCRAAPRLRGDSPATRSLTAPPRIRTNRHGSKFSTSLIRKDDKMTRIRGSSSQNILFYSVSPNHVRRGRHQGSPGALHRLSSTLPFHAVFRTRRAPNPELQLGRTRHVSRVQFPHVTKRPLQGQDRARKILRFFCTPGIP